MKTATSADRKTHISTKDKKKSSVFARGFGKFGKITKDPSPKYDASKNIKERTNR